MRTKKGDRARYSIRTKVASRRESQKSIDPLFFNGQENTYREEHCATYNVPIMFYATIQW